MHTYVVWPWCACGSSYCDGKIISRAVRPWIWNSCAFCTNWRIFAWFLLITKSSYIAQSACVHICLDNCFIPSSGVSLNMFRMNSGDSVSGMCWYVSNTVHEIPIDSVTGEILILLLLLLLILLLLADIWDGNEMKNAYNYIIVPIFLYYVYKVTIYFLFYFIFIIYAFI